MRAAHFALPYNFARFDHQPTTPEVVAFQPVTFDKEQLNAGPHQAQDVKLFEDLLEEEFRLATFMTPPSVCEPRTFTVESGLMSGLRSISAVGSGQNAVLGESMHEMVGRSRRLGRSVDTWQLVCGENTQVVPLTTWTSRESS
ncbi:hypothetical protein MTO96_037030 [Rhipicephalus appendiculatus]